MIECSAKPTKHGTAAAGEAVTLSPRPESFSGASTREGLQLKQDMQAPGSPVPGTSDRECLESWARDADSLRTLVERYLVFVHSSALRQTGDAAQAAEVTRAVFLVLARRARRLRKNTVLA